MAYTGVVLSEESRDALLDRFSEELPEGWEVIADHMTINSGPPEEGPAADRIGEQVELWVVSLARNDRVVALGVESPVPIENDRPHITLAVNRDAGAEPVESNDLDRWEPIAPMTVRGTVLHEED